MSEQAEVDDKNQQSMKSLTKNFETKSEEAKKRYEDKKNEKTALKETGRKKLESNKGKIFKDEANKIREYLDDLSGGQTKIQA